MYPFTDRTDAGRKLSSLFTKETKPLSDMIICAIPNGGVPIAISLAESLNINRVYVYLARKIQFPWTTEAGFGAVTIDGDTIYNQIFIQTGYINQNAIEKQTEKALQELKKRAEVFEKHLLPANLKNKEIFLIDDGLASGITMKTAIMSIVKRNPNRITVAVPTAHARTVQHFEQLANESSDINLRIICLDIRAGKSFAVADAYKYWKDENSEEVLQLLDTYNNN
ncbi:MAG: phosphoribosyltransferase [Candidatus Lokiarchaeota archaeon]|nr:phosphoribosyltransferase [Candidatus Lokiarchaeota archaeon]